MTDMERGQVKQITDSMKDVLRSQCKQSVERRLAVRN
jgi:hypothetical protein